jgi:hypothetical protein
MNSSVTCCVSCDSDCIMIAWLVAASIEPTLMLMFGPCSVCVIVPSKPLRFCAPCASIAGSGLKIPGPDPGTGVILIAELPGVVRTTPSSVQVPGPRRAAPPRCAWPP